jgi:signal transduction histidine kinase
MAVSALAIWIVEDPLLYHAALQLHNTSGMFTLSPAEWRIGLQRLGLSPSVYAVQSFVALNLMTSVMFLIGLLTFVRRSKEWMALVVSYAFVTVGVGIITAYAGGPALARAHPELKMLSQMYLGLADLGWGALFLIPLIFPDGRFVPRWTGWLAPIFFASFILPSDLIPLPAWIAGSLSVLGFGTVLLSPIYCYWRVSDASQREQTRWVLFGFIVGLGTFITLALVQSLIPWLSARPERTVLLALTGGTLVFLGFAFLPITFAIAILRSRLWDIDLILNRTLVYVTLTAGIIGVYVLIVVGLGALLQTQGSIALSLLATAAVAILFHPLHQRLQRGVNRLLYGERDEPYAVLSRLGRQLEGTLAPDAVLRPIVETVAQALKLPYVAIALKQDGGFAVATAVGSEADDPLQLPLHYGGETIGRLILGTRSGEDAFSPSDRRLLEDLARQAGVAVYAVRLTADLQRSRERLVTAREEERRRLRRDLHDGLGPALASVTLMADAARNLLAHDPSAAAALLGDLKVEAQAATAEIRRVVYELRPPALDELGLVPALREQATQYRQGGLHVSVEAPSELPPLPAAVEVAAYRIVQEAITNVVRHAHASTCTVRLEVHDGVCLEIVDDGVGLNGARAGVGLTSMRERAEELGGRFAIESLAGSGTRVRATLPVASR